MLNECAKYDIHLVESSKIIYCKKFVKLYK